MEDSKQLSMLQSPPPLGQVHLLFGPRVGDLKTLSLEEVELMKKSFLFIPSAFGTCDAQLYRIMEMA